jgi:hypothetical protein
MGGGKVNKRQKQQSKAKPYDRPRIDDAGMTDAPCAPGAAALHRPMSFVFERARSAAAADGDDDDDDDDGGNGHDGVAGTLMTRGALLRRQKFEMRAAQKQVTAMKAGRGKLSRHVDAQNKERREMTRESRSEMELLVQRHEQELAEFECVPRCAGVCVHVCTCVCERE